MSISLKSFHMPKESMGYAKKRRKEKISMPKEHEKKMPKSMNNPMLKSMKGKKKKRKVAHTFKGNYQKQRGSSSKEYKNI